MIDRDLVTEAYDRMFEPYDRNAFVHEIGTGLECARAGCGKSPRWRIIHGQWNMQSWVCRVHLPWGMELEQLTQRRGEALGWEYGHPTLTPRGRVLTRTLKVPQVTPATGQITPHGTRGGRVLDYDRNVSAEVNNGVARNEERS